MGAGRPRVPISKVEFEKLCFLQCSVTEIAGWFGCSQDTINDFCRREYGGRNFAETFKEYSQGGKISLRRAQFKLAERSSAMAIWLGKQYLGQTERIEYTTDAVKPLEIEFKRVGREESKKRLEELEAEIKEANKSD